MSKIIGVITARMASTRLPGKVMKKLCGHTVFAHHVERMREVPGIADIYLATSKNPKNMPLLEECKKLKVKYDQGPEEDILGRHINILQKEKADAALRVTGDMPLFDIGALSEYTRLFKKENYDFMYVANMTVAQGTVGELISLKAMGRAHAIYRGPAISQPIKEHIREYKTRGINIPEELCRPEYRLTLDYPEDFKVIKFIYDELYQGKPIDLREVYKLLDDNPQIAKLNGHVKVKGNVTYGAGLLEAPKYTVVRSGNNYVILDANKASVPLGKFLADLKFMFPKTAGRKKI